MLPNSEETKAERDRLRSEYDTVRKAHADLLGMLSRQQMDLALKAFDETLAPRLAAMSTRSKSLVEQQVGQLATTSENAKRQEAVSKWMVLVLICLCAVAGAIAIAVVKGSSMKIQLLTSRSD